MFFFKLNSSFPFFGLFFSKNPCNKSPIFKDILLNYAKNKTQYCLK